MNTLTFKYVFILPTIEVVGSIIDDGIGSTAATKVAKSIYAQLVDGQKEDIVDNHASSKKIKNALRLSITDDQDGKEKDPESVLWEAAHTLLDLLK